MVNLGKKVEIITSFIEHCTGNAKVVGSNSVQKPEFFSGHFSSSVMAAFSPFILSFINV